ncbi:MAG: DNA repair protein RecN [Chromatiales bacterium]|nr:DNA repair protein RecN [Chromatiales bacterium]
MLYHLHIRDLVIVRSVELDFRPGMTMLSGETGAGKSILIDALGLALGDRADSGQIREGAERAEVNAAFDLTRLPDARAWLTEHEWDADGECLLRRVVSRQGRSKAYINGHPVPLQNLQELGDRLVSIHGQHAHHALLKNERQRELLDDYASHGGLLEDTARSFRRWQKALRELEQLQQAAEARRDRLDLLSYQVAELDALDLRPDEWNELASRQQLLANAEQLKLVCDELHHVLYEDERGNVDQLLGHCLERISPYQELHPTLHDAAQMLESAQIQAREAAIELRDYGDNLDWNPADLAELDKRLGQIHELARKHRIGPEELPDLLQQMHEELAQLKGEDLTTSTLAVETAQHRTAYFEAAGRLSDSRQRAAKALAKAVTKEIQGLGMPKGRVEIQLEAMPPERANAHGQEQIALLVSANPGQSAQALAKVASGGELSRISLAIQVVTAATGRTPTLIFDEVDTGIGGGVAEIVGRLLRRLGQHRQVFCVSHLPQVAAQAHQHLRVAKRHDRNGTQTRIEPLAEDERVSEIARMLGGLDITDHTLAHAREMLERAAQAGA